VNNSLFATIGVRKALFMSRFILILILFLYLPSYAKAEVDASRSLFVSVIEKDFPLKGKKEITQLIDFAKKARIKTLFVQIYRANMSWFPSKIADQTPYEICLKNVGEDPFALLIKKAHAEGIEVHAWLNLLTLSKNVKAPLLKKYGPGILTRNIKLKKTIEDYKIDQQYFLDPGDLRVRQELGDMVDEILRAYPKLDGVQFDYIRYPDFDPFYGYAPMNVERFKKATGIRVIKDDDPLWQNWKRAQVTDFLKDLIKRVRVVRPKIHITTTGCMSYSRAYHEAFQDWPLWVNSGLVEFVTVMSYPDNVEEFKKNIEDARKRVDAFSKIKLGVGAYKFVTAPITFTRQFDLCEKAGSGGCAVFYYGSLLQNQALSAYLINSRQKR
jgi:uncharacterized lipoprotein YddW (UPF0748 family)